MSESYKKLKAKQIQLETEILSLREECQNLQQTQSAYEQIIGENNAAFLHADMARIELEQIFSAYTDSMWVVRDDGIVMRANDAMLKLLNKTTDEVIGKTCTDLISHDLCNKNNCPFKKNGNKAIHEHDVQLQSTNKELRDKHFLLTSAPLITIDGSSGIVIQFKDITIRKQSESALEQANIALEKIALTDGLTQIANRRCFDETLAKEWQRLQRTRQPISLLLGDIDYFKKFNDHYGHQAGDDCLRRVGRSLAETVMRPADLAARYGGEEFVILLPNVDSPGGVKVADKILEAIAQLKIEHQKSEVSDIISISIGAATLIPTANQQPESLIALADEALYLAKRSGRNQVIQAEISPAQ